MSEYNVKLSKEPIVDFSGTFVTAACSRIKDGHTILLPFKLTVGSVQLYLPYMLSPHLFVRFSKFRHFPVSTAQSCHVVLVEPPAMFTVPSAWILVFKRVSNFMKLNYQKNASKRLRRKTSKYFVRGKNRAWLYFGIRPLWTTKWEP